MRMGRLPVTGCRLECVAVAREWGNIMRLKRISAVHLCYWHAPNVFSLSVRVENHRLESSYQNHLVLKVLVVSINHTFSTLAVLSFSDKRAASLANSPLIMSVLTLYPIVQLLQLFCLAVLHRLCHAGHGAPQTGRLTFPPSFFYHFLVS